MPASMKHVVSVPWTDEERTLLRQLWENGLGPVLIGRCWGAPNTASPSRRRRCSCRDMRQQPGAAPPPEPRQRPATTTTTRRPHAAAAAE